MTAPTIDLNADAGESFGRWTLGDDEALFRHITTANIACGYHAGDPATMRSSLIRAREAGIAAGAHPGYPDLLGFGRRALPATDSDVVDYILYQVGALAGLAAVENVPLTHVKPHGALMGRICRSPELATRVARALQPVLPGVPLMFAPTEAMRAVTTAGLPVIPENAADLDFDQDGINIVEPVPRTKDPEAIADRALEMARGTVRTVGGTVIPMPVRSICVHGDRPNAVAVAAAVRRRLESAGFLLRAPEQAP
ncbi:5-oxoprolinase subunit PxpA [Amycolatopsis sp. BJA-103]|uniref:5-oxoprolinase subunit PxpA n=1 Tax=Amycolatopsis sp. BJA-103 TaxID=1911175 RepID=UPI000C78D35E|nr:5-oxoprolinase subunit PxpA [Amycolatopsis sp. BJA-103]AUI58371.1 lactam utilization protein LamB [Amycolatopsis sp. BJA-103]PNE14765.1 lactam utilization protein LamB [Amycolatopsis sp. BJA-103]